MLTWPELINSFACMVLSVGLLAVAHLVSAWRNPLHAAWILMADVMLFAQSAAPFLGWSPATWLTALTTSFLAVSSILLRKRIWQFARLELGDIESAHPIRRTKDLDQESLFVQRAPEIWR